MAKKSYFFSVFAIDFLIKFFKKILWKWRKNPKKHQKMQILETVILLKKSKSKA